MSLLTLKKDGQPHEHVANGNAHINTFLAEAQEMVRSDAELPVLSFEFNGVYVNVDADTNLETLYRDYDRAARGLIVPQVGPNPKPELSEEEKLNDKRLRMFLDAMGELRAAKGRIKTAEEKLQRFATELEIVFPE